MNGIVKKQVIIVHEIKRTKKIRQNFLDLFPTKLIIQGLLGLIANRMQVY